MEWVTIPSRSVTHEDGRHVDVPPFEVARHPVAVHDFAAFVQETGYVTTAERSGEPVSFRDHGGAVVGIETPVEQQSVAFISWDDATAFARHHGWRLPTDEQWLAAAVVDWLSEIDEAQYWTEAFGNRVIDMNGPEWTSTTPRDDLAVVRSHPRYALFHGWTNREGNFKTLPRQYYNEIIGFRVVR